MSDQETGRTTKPRRTQKRKSQSAESNQSQPMRKTFKPETLLRTVIAIPLIERLDDLQPIPVVIDLNLDYPQGRDDARKWIIQKVEQLIEQMGTNKAPHYQGLDLVKSEYSQQYLFGRLEGDIIRELVKQDGQPKGELRNPTNSLKDRAIFRVWLDFEVKALINRSIGTVKADAAHSSFGAFGEDIVWAVLDSGIEKTHPHFDLHKNLDLSAPLAHKDFTNTGNPEEDAYGHGTHVAGIIAGEVKAPKNDEKTKEGKKIHAYTRRRDEQGEVTYDKLELEAISGMAPKCKLLSFKVLDDNGDGLTSSLIAAISAIQELNGYGRRLLVHGVNLSVGYPFDPEWFACGQTPLCVEVNRLVKSGVVVVAAAGNTGYGSQQSQFLGTISAGIDLTINDPGNADLAITVGSTHKDMPHVYGTSYFSSKGPTGDGRLKPDLVAPGERILSCAAGSKLKEIQEKAGDCDYLEESGTSMAAPHVSGLIASFLSIRREFIGNPQRVKEIFLSTATDLKRERYFQGYGLVDLIRAIQSV
jgi:serine protease AprX